MSIARGGGARRVAAGVGAVLIGFSSPEAAAQVDVTTPRLRSAVLERDAVAAKEEDGEGESLRLGEEPASNDGPSADDLLFLPKGDVFRPLLADPRQVRSYASLHRLQASFGDFWVGTAGFGETFGIVGQRDAENNGWQVSIAGAVSSFFNFDGFDNDLINTDFVIGIPVTWRAQPFSLRANLYHQSSHISDEFYRFEAFGPTDAIPTQKLSFEAIDVVLGYEPVERARVYAGANRIFSADNAVRRWSYRMGGDWESPVLFGRTRAVAGVDIRWWAETGYQLERSLKLGLQFGGSTGVSRTSLLLEYFRGPYHHGFFYVHKVETLGLGLLFQF